MEKSKKLKVVTRIVQLIMAILTVGLIVIILSQMRNQNIITMCTLNTGYARSEESCLASARSHDFWLFLSQPRLPEVQRALIKHYLSFGDDKSFAIAEDRAKKWNLDIYDLAHSAFLKNVKFDWSRDEARAIFKQYGNWQWIRSSYEELQKLADYQDCESANNCFEKLQMYYDYKLFGSDYLIAKCWELLLRHRDYVSFENIEILFNANLRGSPFDPLYMTFLGQEKSRILSLIYLVMGYNKGALDESQVEYQAREFGILLELRQYVGTYKPVLRILMDHNFLLPLN